LTGDFYFTGPIKVEISQEPTKSDSKSKMEALYWQSIMNDTDPAVFESYLKKYPDGEFSDLAKIKISNLKKGQKNEILPSLEQPAQSDSKKVYGYLKLTSDPPGASVLLDGSPLGNTDMNASNIEPGKRKIEIQKDCFKVKTAEVMIKAGQQVSMNLKLEPSCGGISATSDPSGADILIDSKPVGITPAEVMDISEGKHQITIRKDGFQDWQEGIIVKTGKTVAVKSGKLKPTAVGQQTAADTAGLPATPQLEYRLTIDSNPSSLMENNNIPPKQINMMINSDIGGNVLINGKIVGTIENRLFVDNKPLFIENIQTGEVIIEIVKDSTRAVWKDTINESIYLKLKNGIFSAFQLSQPIGTWRINIASYDKYLASTGRFSTEEIIQVRNEDGSWAWTSSGWGRTPQSQYAIFKSTQNEYEFQFIPGSNVCLEGKGGFTGEKCTHLIISENWQIMSIYNKDKKIGAAERAW
jgi:hypothetical protein